MTVAKPNNLVDLAAEQLVLGTILLNPDSLAEALAEVQEADFSDTRHGLIFGAMRALARDGQAADLILVVDALRGSGELGRIGGEGFVAGLTEVVPSVSRVAAAARIIAERARARRMYLFFGQQRARLFGGTRVDEVNVDVSRAVNSQTRVVSIQTAAEVAERTRAEVHARAERGGGLPGLSTGFSGIDQVTGGLGPGNLWVLAARPSMGKTTMSWNTVLYLAGEGRRVYFASFEMKGVELMERAAANLAGVPLVAIREGRLRHADLQRVDKLLTAVIPGMNILMDEANGTAIEQLVARVKMEHLRRPLDLLVVDYLQLITCPGASVREREVAEISAALKRLALDLEVPVLVLSQLNRESEKRPGGRPRLADLRDSGAIEQDADVVLLLNRDRLAPKGSVEHGVVTIDIAKNRHGPTGEVRLLFEGEYSRFLPESI